VGLPVLADSLSRYSYIEVEYKHQPGLVDGINLKSSLEEIYSLPIILSKLLNRLSLPVLCGCGLVGVSVQN